MNNDRHSEISAAITMYALQGGMPARLGTELDTLIRNALRAEQMEARKAFDESHSKILRHLKISPARLIKACRAVGANWFTGELGSKP